jgi:hypothetical protein
MRVTNAELNRLEDNFDTADLLCAPEIRDDVGPKHE